jgi:hypothetical protein
VTEEQPDTRELRETQSRREADEEALARSAADEQETAIHRRRAEKAHYLQRKLAERAKSELESGSSAAEEPSGPDVNE